MGNMVRARRIAMARTDDLHTRPADIAVPHDDGACAHLPGMHLSSLLLASTDGGPVDLARVPGRIVVYVYLRTGRPDQPPLVEDWNQIPGARGCTPQSCGFRDHHAELRELGAQVFGLSTQDTHYQREMVERLHLPFPVLSDARLELATALRLPTFTVAHTILIKRLTFIARNGAIEKVFYPVFPPDRKAADVVAWLRG
jgi:peroxiredoxin